MGVFSKEHGRIQARITQRVNNHKGLSLWFSDWEFERNKTGFIIILKHTIKLDVLDI